MWLLLVEDEIHLARSLQRGLEEEGYAVDLARDGDEGYRLAAENDYDVAVVDWRLPRRDGRALVLALRGDGRTLPLLMLTALGDVDHRVAGLDAGADDYLTKPFAFEELLARLRALTRRTDRAVPAARLRAGPLVLDPARRRVTVDGRLLWLRTKEYALLDALHRRPGDVRSRTVLAERAWGTALTVSDHLLDVTISGLRQKLADAGCGDAVRITTVRGVGYRLDVDDAAEEVR